MQFSGFYRFVWNKALSLIKDRMYAQRTDKMINTHLPQFYKQPDFLPRYEDTARYLTLWKHLEEYIFLKSVHSQILQQSLKDLYKSIDSAFTKGNEIRFPSFRKKGKLPDSFRYPQGFKIKGNRAYLPKIGWVRFFKSRDIQGKPKNVTVRHYADGWHISIVAEREIDISKKRTDNPVGIDVGVKKIVTLSNGNILQTSQHEEVRKEIKETPKKAFKETASDKERR